MSEKSYKAKWTGPDKQRVIGVGEFLPGVEVQLSAEKAALLRGVNDKRYVIEEISNEPKKKEK